MKKNILFLSAGLAIASAFTACQPKVDTAAMDKMNAQIDSTVTAKLDEFRATKMTECSQMVMDTAAARAAMMMEKAAKKPGKSNPKPPTNPEPPKTGVGNRPGSNQDANPTINNRPGSNNTATPPKVNVRPGANQTPPKN